MKPLLALSVLALLAGCEPPSASQIRATHPIIYDRDARTGLCFAMTSTYTYGSHWVVSITNVPCSPEVLRLVTPGPSL